MHCSASSLKPSKHVILMNDREILSMSQLPCFLIAVLFCFPLLFQNCQTFNSLSCLSITADDCSHQNQFSPGIGGTKSWTTASLCTLDVMPGRTPACTPVPEPHSNAEECKSSKEDFSYEESEFCATEDESSRKEEDNSSWRNSGTGGDNIFQLDGELDIEQIENN